MVRVDGNRFINAAFDTVYVRQSILLMWTGLANNLTKNYVHSLSGGHVITLLSEALPFTTYLSLYSHKIVKFYFFCSLTFISSFDWCLRAKKHTMGLSFIKFNQNFVDVRIFEKTLNFDNFSGFCSQEFDLFMKDLAIFRLKCNEQHSSIPKSQIKLLTTLL